MGKVGRDHWRSSRPFFSSRIPQSTFLRIVSSDSFWISAEETPQPLWVWHVSLAEDLQCEGCTEEWGLHRVVFLAQEIIYSNQAWELSLGFLEEHALLLMHSCDLDVFVWLCQKKWVTAVFFRLVVLFLLVFVNNHFFKSNGSVWRQAWVSEPGCIWKRKFMQIHFHFKRLLVLLWMAC